MNFIGFLLVTVQVLNSYDIFQQTEKRKKKDRDIMARKKEILKNQELDIFYRNFLYMWNEMLLITPYEAKKNDDEGVLPAFCTLSRIYADAKKKLDDAEYMPDEKDIPTTYQLKKIVDYYNRNLIPAITPGEFIHTELKTGYHAKESGKKKHLECFNGLYYGFYFEDQEEIHGAVLRIQRENENIRVIMISGFDFSSTVELEQAKQINSYAEFYRFAKNYTHFYYYEGNAVVGEKILHINLAGRDASQRMITLSFNIERFLDRYYRFPDEYHFKGGMGFAMADALSYARSSPRFYQMGIISEMMNSRMNQQELKSMMESSEMKELLRLKGSHKYVMTLDSDKTWFRFIKEKCV